MKNLKKSNETNEMNNEQLVGYVKYLLLFSQKNLKDRNNTIEDKKVFSQIKYFQLFSRKTKEQCDK